MTRTSAHSAGSHPATWTTRELLTWMTTSFADRGIEPPRLCAELLLAHVLGCERLELYTQADRPASGNERGMLRALVRRALDHEPIQYLVGVWPYFGAELKVDERALIPRPCTEQIPERVLHLTEDREAAVRIADVCTGSGCVAVVLAKHLPSAEVVATDISAEALALASENADLLGVGERVERREGDLLAPIAGERFDWVVANPPYVSDGEWEAVATTVKSYEPPLALRGGVDGLDVVRRLLEGAADVLADGGRLMVEVAASHADEAAAIARTRGGLREVEVLGDFEGYPRFVVAERA